MLMVWNASGAVSARLPAYLFVVVVVVVVFIIIYSAESFLSMLCLTSIMLCDVM